MIANTQTKKHVFNPAIAENVGINAALLFDYFAYWTVRNMDEGKNISRGKAWIYTTAKALGSIYIYLTEAQIKYALRKLQDAGMIENGGAVATPYGRATAYTVPLALARDYENAKRRQFGGQQYGE